MSAASITSARDEILTLFTDYWKAQPDSSTVPLFYWDRKANQPASSLPWARVTLAHFTGAQASLAGETGQRTFERNGAVTVQIFTPFGSGLSVSDKLTKVAVDAFEGKATPSAIWFRNVRVNEIGQDGAWFQVNVVADFTYDEIK